MARVDVVFSALAARQQVGPCAHQRLELFEFFPGQRMHPPGLHIAAGGRAACAFENVAHGCFGHRRGQKGAAGVSGSNGV